MEHSVDLSRAIGEFLLRQVRGDDDVYVVKPVIPYAAGDKPIHTDDHPICEDETCPCRQQGV